MKAKNDLKILEVEVLTIQNEWHLMVTYDDLMEDI